MKWCGISGVLFCCAVWAAPPGAMISQKLGADHEVILPPGFRLSVWARVSGARMMAVAPNDDVLVSQPGSGSVTLLHPGAGGSAPAPSILLNGLKSPHGLAFDTAGGTTWLYVAETDQIDRYVWGSMQREVISRGLPSGGAHPLKNIAIAPDHTVYVGIGSSCNACAEDTTSATVRGSVYAMKPDGSGLRLFARGLRNAEGLAFVPGTDQLWAAVNNRDEIVYPRRDSSGQYGQIVRSYVDDHPPELFTAVRNGGNYGWPFCDSTQDSAAGLTGMAFDVDYELNRDGHVDCGAMDRVSKGIQAHSAPLGLHFLQGSNFAAPYRAGAAVALHGSWDRSQPTGYKVVWFPWNKLTSSPGDAVDLVTGLLGFARPVDTAVLADGSMLISDDQGGTIYRLEWAPSAVSAANGYGVIAPGSYAAVYSSTALPVGGEYTLQISDSSGKQVAADVVFASSGQINFVVPEGVAAGTAHLLLKSGSSSVDLGAPEVRPVAPGLFTLSGDGSGAAAVTASDTQGKSVDTNAIDVSKGPVYVALYGTGIRHAAMADVTVSVDGEPVRVLYAGAQPTYPALDQVNIELPSSLAGRGAVTVSLSVAGVSANDVELRIR